MVSEVDYKTYCVFSKLKFGSLVMCFSFPSETLFPSGSVYTQFCVLYANLSKNVCGYLIKAADLQHLEMFYLLLRLKLTGLVM